MQIPDGVAEAAALSAVVDGVLAGGLARISDAQLEALGELASAFVGTPLGAAADAAVKGLAAGELVVRHMAVVAACREALEGARTDALFEAAAEAMGLVIQEPAEEATEPFTEASAGLLPGVQQWLMELALVGLDAVESQTVSSATNLLPAIQAQPQLARLGTLITLWVDEMLGWNSDAEVPERRWSDLWCRALLHTLSPPPAVREERVSGTLSIFGAELLHGPHAFQLLAHGVLETDEARRLVRVPVSHWRVDSLSGVEALRLLHERVPKLIEAVATPAALQVQDMGLRTTGELRWTGTVTGSRPLAVADLSVEGAALSRPAARDRHPIQIALPAVFSGKLADELDGLPVDRERVSPWVEEILAPLGKAVAVFGLVRFDQVWSVQPLSGTTKTKWITPAKTVAKAIKLKSPAAVVLQERASRLLRA